MKKEKIYIGLEYIYGPLQKLYEDKNGNNITSCELVDNDEIVQKLDYTIGELWCSLFSKDTTKQKDYIFDEKREKN